MNRESLFTFVSALILLSALPVETSAEPTPLWVAVGYGGRRMISEDGKQWTITAEWEEHGGDDSNNLMSVVYGKGKFVAVGGGSSSRGSAGHILASIDGREWKSVYQASFRVHPIVFSGDRFVAGGPNRQLLWSKDGERWYTGARIADPRATHFRFGAFGNGTFLLCGSGGGRQGGFCLATGDGKWSRSFKSDLPLARGIAFGKNTFVMVGMKGLCMSSKDGSDWKQQIIPGAGDLRWVTWTGTEFLAGYRKIYRSFDGFQWEPWPHPTKGIVLWTDGQSGICTAWPGRMFYSSNLKSWDVSNQLTENGINAVAYRGAAETKIVRP